MKKCEEIRKKIEDYLEERLSSEDTLEFEKHILTCSSCFRKVVKKDPAKLFLLLRRERLNPALFPSFTQEVMERIERKRTRRWAPLVLRPAYLLMIAVAIVGAILAWWRFSGGLKGGTPPFVSEIVETGAQPMVQDIGGKARVYQLEIDGETQLVMVVLPNLKFLR